MVNCEFMMKKTDVYFVPYHSNPRQDFNGCSGQYAVVERAINQTGWPYDNGDDPSFYAQHQGALLTWGVCRQQIRNAIRPGSIVVFFSFTGEGCTTCYRMAAVVTVAEKLDRTNTIAGTL
jgi:hypothetical protein